ncbi:MAG: hypothetical protein OEU95_09535 [Nitrospirota bacterium]|nr:hypothetical protein [Nitrospirota bacterium]
MNGNISSKLILYGALLILTAIFIDGNMIRVPVKIFIGTPAMVSLGYLIIFFLLLGSLIPVTGYLMLVRRRKAEEKDE